MRNRDPLLLVFHHRTVNIKIDLLTDHHLRQGLYRRLLGLHRADILALSEDRYAVGDSQHLVELMGDDDDGFAVRFHVAEHLEELVGLLRRQHRGGLVENQNVRTPVKGLDNLQRLLLRDSHVVDLAVGIDIKAVTIADFLDALGDRASVFRLGLVHAQRHILGSGENVDQLEVLVDHANTQGVSVLRGLDMNLFAVHKDLSRIRMIDAREHIHQCGLAGTVLSEKR